MRSKYQSQTVKHGNGSSHDKSIANVLEFLKQNNVDTYTEWYEEFILDFNRENKLRFDYGHSYDIACKKGIRMFFIEVDGPKHSKKNQQINDGIATKYSNEVLKTEVIRLDKTECLGDPEDVEVYLMRALWKAVK